MFTTDRSNETQTTDPNASTQSSSRWSFWGQENFTQCEIKILVAWNARRCLPLVQNLWSMPEEEPQVWLQDATLSRFSRITHGAHGDGYTLLPWTNWKWQHLCSSSSRLLYQMDRGLCTPWPCSMFYCRERECSMFYCRESTHGYRQITINIMNIPFPTMGKDTRKVYLSRHLVHTYIC